MKLFLVCLMFSTTACLGADDGPANCQPAELASPTVANALDIGFGQFDGFQPIVDGSPVELELGTQGGWMIRPVLRIDATALGADESTCIRLALEVDVEGFQDQVVIREIPPFQYRNSVGYSEPIIVLLSFDVESVRGRMATLHATVEGSHDITDASVDMTLVNLE